MSVSEYSDRRFKPRQHQYVVSMSKTLNPHCFSRLSCEMCTRRDHPREGCLLFSVVNFPEIAPKNKRIFTFNFAQYSSLYVVHYQSANHLNTVC